MDKKSISIGSEEGANLDFTDGRVFRTTNKSRLKCSNIAVHNALVNFKNFGTYSNKKRTGRPRKTTPRDDHLMRRIAVRLQMSSSKKIRLPLLARGTYIPARTVSKRLVSDFGLKSCKPAKKPRLAPAMKVKRLAFAKKYVTWTLFQWRRVLFSDESSIQQFNARKRHVRKPVGKRFGERYTVQTMKHPPCVMMWSSPGPGYRLTLTYQKLANLKIICAYGVTILLEYLFINNIINKNS